LLDVFSGVPMFEISKSDLEAGIPAIDLLAVNTQVFPSKGEARKMLQANGVAINKSKIDEQKVLSVGDLINNQYLLVQKGKKNYFLINVL